MMDEEIYLIGGEYLPLEKVSKITNDEILRGIYMELKSLDLLPHGIQAQDLVVAIKNQAQLPTLIATVSQPAGSAAIQEDNHNSTVTQNGNDEDDNYDSSYWRAPTPVSPMPDSPMSSTPLTDGNDEDNNYDSSNWRVPTPVSPFPDSPMSSTPLTAENGLIFHPDVVGVTEEQLRNKLSTSNTGIHILCKGCTRLVCPDYIHEHWENYCSGR